MVEEQQQDERKELSKMWTREGQKYKKLQWERKMGRKWIRKPNNELADGPAEVPNCPLIGLENYWPRQIAHLWV
jgi:hypothetical protein